MLKGRKVFKILDEPESAISKMIKKLDKRFLESLLNQTCEVNIEDAVGRLAAENIYSPIDLPYYPRSLVDGCSVKAKDLIGADESNPVSLRYVGRIHVGEEPTRRVREGECLEVDTGSWVPLGTDAIVPIEYVELEGDWAVISRTVNIGMNIALPSTDIAKGDLVISKGTLITPEIVASLSSVGIKRLLVTRRIKFAVGSTGDELIEPGEPITAGKIYNSNRSFIVSKLRRLGYEVIDMGIIEDEEELLVDKLVEAADSADVIIFTGGTSAGPEDVLYKAVEKVGSIIVHGLRIKPGKPTILGEIKGKPFFGLPGNPRSAVNVFDKVVYRYLFDLGLIENSLYEIEAIMALNIYGTRGRKTFLPVIIDGKYAWPVARDSYMIASYGWADGLMELPSEAYTPIYAGDKVKIKMFRNPIKTVFALTDLTDLRTVDTVMKDVLNHDAITPYRIVPVPRDQLTDEILDNITVIIGTDILLEGLDYSSFNTRSLGRRKLFLFGKGNECNYTGIRSGYGVLKGLVNGNVLYHPRFQGLAVLYKQGYIDCMISPKEFVSADDLDGIDEVGEEEVLLLYKDSTIDDDSNRLF